MPIYEYACEKCNKRLEVVQKFSDPLLTECPDCKGKLKKLVSNSSFVLKGSGWYVTDYARKGSNEGSGKGHKKSGGTEKADEKTGKKPSEAKAESKATPASNSSPNNT
jgi:putative FmdB family regulatory protein